MLEKRGRKRSNITKRECVQEVRMEQENFWGDINGRGLEKGWKVGVLGKERER